MPTSTGYLDQFENNGVYYDLHDADLRSKIGQANGIAELDSDGKVPSGQLPSYVDEVTDAYYADGEMYIVPTYEGYLYEGDFYKDEDHTELITPEADTYYFDKTGEKYYQYSALAYVEVSPPTPITPASDKIYVNIAVDPAEIYRWTGSTYAKMSSGDGGLVLGETAQTAYRGDRGKTAYDHSQLTSGNPHNVTKYDIGLDNVDNTSDSTKKTNFTGSIASGNTGFTTGGDVYTALVSKADKVTSATNGNIAGLDGNGNLTDAGWSGDKTTTNASGNPISITGLKSNQLAVNPVITYNPIQDLHGQSKPYPAGGGKNKFNKYNVTLKEMTQNGETFTNNNTDLRTTFYARMQFYNGTTLVKSTSVSGNEIIANGRYSITATISSSDTVDNVRLVHGGQLRNIGVWSLGKTYTNITLTISFDVTGYNPSVVGGLTIKNIQIEEDDQATSYAPYENICPISGYDKIEVLSCGKNLISKINQGTRNQSTGIIDTSTTTRVTCDYIFTNQVAYTVSATSLVSGKTINVAYQEYTSNGDGTYRRSKDSGWKSVPVTFTPSTSSLDVLTSLTFRFSDDSTINPSNITAQMEKGSPATTYVPYVKATSISESLGQTVYGGSLDVRSGKLTVKYFYKNAKDLTWTLHSISPHAITSLTGVLANTSPICSHYKGVVSSWTYLQEGEIAWNSGTLRIYDSTHTTSAETWDEWINGNDIQMLFELATPIEIQLTPHEISMLKDYAYISTNGTSISLSYHNGEMASLADVSQLLESVEKQVEYSQYNKAGSYVDLSPYTSSYYEIPCDGYILIASQAVTSGSVRLKLDGANSVTFGGIYMNITGSYQVQSTFVRKGMLVSLIQDVTGTRKRFVPLIP